MNNEEQAVDYIKCAIEASSLSSSLLNSLQDTDQKTAHDKNLKRCASSLFWLWKVITEYMDEEEILNYINKFKDEDV